MPENEQNKKTKYLFDTHVGPVLQKGSLAFNVSSAGIIIRINKSLLPQHCDLELIEDALACLEKNSQDTQLLETLAEYTKNSLSERIGYWVMGGGTTVRTSIGKYFAPLKPILLVARLSVLAGLLAVATIAPPITIPLIGAAVVLGAWNLYRHGSIGMKIGRWIGNLLKGTGQKSVHLRECEDNLKVCINKYKTAAQQRISSMLAHQVSSGYPSFEESVAEKMPATQVSEEVDGKPSYASLFKSPDEAKDSASNTLDNSLESTEDTHTLRR